MGYHFFRQPELNKNNWHDEMKNNLFTLICWQKKATKTHFFGRKYYDNFACEKQLILLSAHMTLYK